MKTGDKVSYKDINQWRELGIIVSIGPTKHGGDCIVKWYRTGIESEECLFNLRMAG